MGVNLSGNQSIEQTGIESSQIREVQVSSEYNPSLERYKAVMATFSPGINYDAFASAQMKNAKPINDLLKNKNTQHSKKSEAVIKNNTTAWLASILGIEEVDDDDPFADMMVYDEVLPKAGFGRTIKEYKMMQKVLSA